MKSLTISSKNKLSKLGRIIFYLFIFVNDKIIFMKYEINQLVIGEVTNVKPYAVFLVFENGVQGLLHISEISNNYIRDIEKYAVVGDKLKVKIVAIDENNGFLRVSLKKVPEEEAFSSHVNFGRKIPTVEDTAFKPLEEKLPQWIEQSIKEIREGK